MKHRIKGIFLLVAASLLSLNLLFQLKQVSSIFIDTVNSISVFSNAYDMAYCLTRSILYVMLLVFTIWLWKKGLRTYHHKKPST